MTKKERPTKDETFEAKEKLDFLAESDHKIHLQHDKLNEHDPQAIKVVVQYDNMFLKLGYIPKECKDKEEIMKQFSNASGTSHVIGKLVKEKAEYEGKKRAYFIDVELKKKNRRFSYVRAALMRR
jgi:hypothetical protein